MGNIYNDPTVEELLCKKNIKRKIEALEKIANELEEIKVLLKNKE